MEITLLSGMKGEVRGLSLKRLQELARTKKDSIEAKASWVSHIIQNCWLRTTDLGPVYKADTFNWDDALLADRFGVVLAASVATYGKEFPIGIRCQNKECDSKYDWELNLLDLPTQTFPPEVIEVLSSGENRFEKEVLGQKIFFMVPTGKTEMALSAIRESIKMDPGPLDTVLARVVEVEGMSKPEWTEWIGDLSLGDADELKSFMDSCDAAYFTAFDTECPKCDTINRVQLPFGPALFQARRKKAASESRGPSSQPSKTPSTT